MSDAGAKGATSSDAILDRLLSLHPKIIDLSLDRMLDILEKLGHPEKKLPPVIHVAGTNGKGSTIAFMRSILEAAGLHVHVYTSPHLVKFHERIRLGHENGSETITEIDLAKALEYVEQVNEGEPITYFEITTAAAFHLFATHPADVLLLEVGLGGRLDATNVIEEPLATVITPVSLDHMQYLGDTIEKIAFEKAGIIKNNCPCVISQQESGAEDIILEQAHKKNAETRLCGMNWQTYLEHGRMVYQDEEGLLDLPLPSLKGDHQILNAGTAIATIRAQNRFTISDAAIEQGLITASWPARMQKLYHGSWLELSQKTDIEFWLDGGHNPAAAKILKQEIQKLNAHKNLPCYAICGMLDTKDSETYFKHLSDDIDKLIGVTIPNQTASLNAIEIEKVAKTAGIDSISASSIEDAVATISSWKKPCRLFFIGSLYFAGEVLRQENLIYHINRSA